MRHWGKANRSVSCQVVRKGLIHLPSSALNENRASSVKFLDEHNILDRALTAEEFRRMVDISPAYLKPIVLCAHSTGMRNAEILGLTWERVDLKTRCIRLWEVDTKRGERIASIREIFSRVCRDAGLADVVFHTLRHAATTNLRKAEVDALTAMKITEHQTMAVFMRYNSIDESDLSAAQERVDAYISTTAEKTAIENF